MEQGLHRRLQHWLTRDETGDKTKRPRLWSTRSRSWLPIEGTEVDLAILGDGTLVAALEVSPVDTALMSREDVQGHVARYWQGLRSIHFPVSICVGTRRQEVSGYIQEISRRLDRLAEGGGEQQHISTSESYRGEQDGFLGMLLEEQCRLITVLLAEHLRSRYALLAILHNPSSGLKGLAQLIVGDRARSSPASRVKVEETRDDLELKVKKVEDVLRQAGLKYQRCSGRRLAAEVLRLARPDLATEEMSRLEKTLEPTAMVGGELEGESCEVAFSPQR